MGSDGAFTRLTLFRQDAGCHNLCSKNAGVAHDSSQNIIVGTPEEAACELCLDLPGRGPDYPLWAAFVEAAERADVLVDAVIVDEAQSYDKDLLEALLALCPKSCQMYADPFQRDSTGMWRPPGDPRTFWLTRNCRNALPIARLVARLSGSLPPGWRFRAVGPLLRSRACESYEDLLQELLPESPLG
jgi:hypothetical protein